MNESSSNPDFHVLVIGAGSVGLLIAQRLKMLGIKCTVFERELYLNQRPRDWNFGVYWSQAPFSECLSEDVISNLSTALVDPFHKAGSDDHFPMFNGETGELIQKMPIPNTYRLNRSRFKALTSKGVYVEVSSMRPKQPFPFAPLNMETYMNRVAQYGKRLSTISRSSDTETVTAIFEDGSEATGNLLIGADGSRSKVREYLLGPEKAGLQPLPLLGCMALRTLPADLAIKIRKEQNGLAHVAHHPLGYCSFMSIHDVPNPEQPETWVWMLALTWSDPGTERPSGAAEIRSAWMQRSKHLAEPLRSAYLSVPKDVNISCERLSEWRTIAWDNHQGKVTLAGDAAHPMTFHRGQGLNNGIHDAAYLCRALRLHCENGKPLQEVISAYEQELVERGRNAVISSGQNSLMVHDWEQLKKSPIYRLGIAPDRKQ